MVTTHAHPGLVAVTAGVPDAEGKREFSSGLLLAPRLVLASRHGVAPKGEALPDVEVALAAGPRGAVRLTEPVPGTVAWLGAGGLDAALIELPEFSEPLVAGRIEHAQDAPTGFPPAGFLPTGLIWGEPAGTRPVAVTTTGMPGFAAEATSELAEAETARGTLEPGT